MRVLMRKGTNGLGAIAAIFNVVPSDWTSISYCGDDIVPLRKRHGDAAAVVI